MLTKIEVLNYRALRYINQSLEPFQVLIGPNASGKTTFLDVIAFIRDVISDQTPIEAIRNRSSDIYDLTWMKRTDWLELAVEARIPEKIRPQKSYTHIRYEIRLGIQEEKHELALLAETLWLIGSETSNGIKQGKLFPQPPDPPDRLTRDPDKNTRNPPGWRKIVSKSSRGNDYFRSETTDWNNLFRLGPKRSALANLPADDSRFPASTWFKQYISEGVQRIMLNSEALRRPSPPQSPRAFLPDGSNLPWVVEELTATHPDRFAEWIDHVRTALPDILAIKSLERPEDRHRYLAVDYASGVSVPSWVVSDGTLRMLALTLLPYLPNLNGLYLIEEPENGIHPRAVETVFQSLSSVYDGQVLVATHSPIILSLASPKQLLCFARTSEGATDIIRGDQHPRLHEWKGEIGLGTLFASGVLG
ncbi:MAG: AAA family ATPase [Anaerolineae bacterium]|nr:AAA family ATPase [Anaerolineae bacterium]